MIPPKVYPLESTLRKRYDTLNREEKRKLTLLFETKLTKPVQYKALMKIINMPVEKLRQEPVERIELFEAFFNCTRDRIYEFDEVFDASLIKSVTESTFNHQHHV